MIMDIKAIPTTYDGVQFRSRLEARWAVYFNAIGIQWEYEWQGFAMPSGCYLPDFWLPEVKLWAEVKPADLTTAERQKVNELVEGTKRGCLLLCGIPRNQSVPLIEPAGCQCLDDSETCGEWCTTPYETDAVISMHKNYPKTEGRFYMNTGSDPIPADPDDSMFPDVYSACCAARSAKFWK